MLIYFFTILTLYVLGSILFVIAPIYRYFDKLTLNVCYLEIAGTGCFVIANVMLFIDVLKMRKIYSKIKFTYKIIIRILYILGASSFLIGAAYRIVDAKTLINVYIDMSASSYFTLSNTVELIYYINKSCKGKHTCTGIYVYKYSIRIFYFFGALIFLAACIYRLIDYITDNTIIMDISAISCFLIPNTMLFIHLVKKTIKSKKTNNTIAMEINNK